VDKVWEGEERNEKGKERRKKERERGGG